MNTVKIEPTDVILNYDCGPITKKSKIYFNGGCVGYVGYCKDTDEWLSFDGRGDDYGECADTRDGAIELLDIDLDSCELIG